MPTFKVSAEICVGAEINITKERMIPDNIEIRTFFKLIPLNRIFYLSII